MFTSLSLFPLFWEDVVVMCTSQALGSKLMGCYFSSPLTGQELSLTRSRPATCALCFLGSFKLFFSPRSYSSSLCWCTLYAKGKASSVYQTNRLKLEISKRQMHLLKFTRRCKWMGSFLEKEMQWKQECKGSKKGSGRGWGSAGTGKMAQQQSPWTLKKPNL